MMIRNISFEREHSHDEKSVKRYSSLKKTIAACNGIYLTEGEGEVLAFRNGVENMVLHHGTNVTLVALNVVNHKRQPTLDGHRVICIAPAIKFNLHINSNYSIETLVTIVIA